MLGKLMKYEIKSTARIFLPLYGALILVSIISRISMNLPFALPTIISSSLFGFLIGTVCIGTLVLTLQRFRRNLLRSEGYLMFTLPVSTDSLIVSKLLISSLWFIASSIVVMISIAIMATQDYSVGEMMKGFVSFLQSIHIDDWRIPLCFAEVLFMGLLTLFSGILMLYACISLSLFANKHRGLWAFGAFIGFNIIGQSLLGGLFSSLDKFDLSFFQNLSDIAQFHTASLIYTLISLAAISVFYLIIRYMLKNKLNLE